MIRFQRAYLPVIAAPLAIGLLVIAVLFGGASRLDVMPPIAVRITGLAVIAWSFWTAAPATLARDRLAPFIWAGMFLVPLIQLVPLPWALWTALPGHQLARDIDSSLGLAPWHGASLAPDRTLNGILALIPALAAWMIGRRLDESGRARIFRVTALLALASAGLGLLQRAAGSTSNLYFYAITNDDSSVGFFSNANHHALFLCCGIVATIFGLAEDTRRLKRWPGVQGILALVSASIITASIVATESRGGVLLLPLAILGGLATLPFNILGIGPKTVRLGAVLVLATGAIFATLLLSGLVGDFGLSNAVTSDNRLNNLPIFARIAADYFPLGSGLGSFDPVFRGYEPAKSLGFSYLNNAHNDYAQIAIEAGVPGILLVLLFFLWLARRLRFLFAEGWPKRTSLRVSWTAAAMVILLLAHSLVDYPLRTAAVSVLFALCCAFLSPPLASSHQHA